METSGGKDYGSSQAYSEQSTDETTNGGDVTTQISSFLQSLIHMPANKKQQLVSTSAAIVRNTNTNTNSNLDENGEKGEIVPQSNENSLNSSPKEATTNEVTINREKAFEVVYGSIKVDRNGAKTNEKCFVVDAYERSVRIVSKSEQKKQPNKLILLEDIPENELIRFGQIFPDDNESIDHFVHCEFCNKYYDFSCLEHPLYQCLDRETLNVPNSPPKEGEDRAALTLPGFLYIRNSQIPNAGKGVFTKVDIPIGIVFGPYEGILLKDAAKANQDGYAWELRTGNGKSFYIDAKDPRYSNWMRYINSPRHEGEQNLIAFQYRGSIFYRVYRPIDKDSELLVWKKIRERIGHNKLHRN